MNELQNKVCVVTGGAGSIGLESARLFLEEGARVLLVDLEAEALSAAARELGGRNIACSVADVSRAGDTRAYLDKAVASFGKIDVLFSNAGNAGVIAPIAEYPDEVFDRVQAVHVRGAYNACKYGLPRMNDGGSIIITSSVAAFRGDPGVTAYITAKIAQIGLMRCVAREAAPRRIRVNTIHPGPTDNAFQADLESNLGAILKCDATAMFNELIPLGRHAAPREIARSVLYLASDQSSFTTGTTLSVTGGMAG
ncbi:SDR family NAD(P)-dependent oxidoreductase [Enhydrobacter sp.]|jgi:NAD(P)-dependent dehydrogenase (short-subunit alcohol dehydrogenase family)|uniref:SDR family NAD(P)-dependent oxidoreductase n=1 Tax=Enhydrobacter sp. TaxID=1894999 RepID=UPI00262F2FD1|nr:SDR family NAD(P)-dependent oxidoreductase [Enhydrobacter sp.]WIM09612.1 MAG: Oxidoreductase, short-chain dehydrogenase/reductase family [Enhydrobacter sp.]